MTLNELQRGESAKIIKIESNGKLKKRLSAMGIISGELITFQRNAPLGDPQEYVLRNSAIAIRKEDALNIEIERGN